MKLSILIFVLTTILYECHGAPRRDIDWDKFEEDLDELIGKIESSFPVHNNGDDFSQLTDPLTPSLVSGTMKNYVSENGKRILTTEVEAQFINNVQYRTVTQYNPETNKKEIKKYECTYLPTFQCVLKETTN